MEVSSDYACLVNSFQRVAFHTYDLGVETSITKEGT